MVKPGLLEILCCPETHQPLREAPVELIADLNQRIAAGSVINRAGEKVAEPIEGGLVREDGKFLYVIRKEIPVMLIDQAIALP